MFKKLRNKMMLFNILTVSLVMITAFAVIYLVIYRNVKLENERRFQAVSATFFAPNRSPRGNIVNGENDMPAAPEQFSVDYGVSFVLFVKDGKLEYVNSQLDFEYDIYMDAFEKVNAAEDGTITLADRKWLFKVAPAPPQIVGFPGLPDNLPNKRIVFLDITNGVKILRTLMFTLSGVGIGVLLALLWISYRFATRAVRPIENSYNKQKQFITDASHELRTPLAVIGANVDAIIASGEETVNSQKEWFDYIRAELRRTGKMVDDLLYLAKSENIRSEDRLPFDLSAVCETVCASMEAALYENGVEVKTFIDKGITAIADSEKIAQVLYILLDNAGKYTPSGGEITVTLNRFNDWAIIQVMNTGEGIAAVDLPKIFDRFYRADPSRSTENGGFGLGLSIAKTIIDRSGGTINAESVDGLTTFTVRIKMS